MITRIGIIAGEIWRLLEEEETMPLSILIAKIGEGVPEDKDMVCMSVGWLAREGHIVLEREDSGYTVHLRKSLKQQ